MKSYGIMYNIDLTQMRILGNNSEPVSRLIPLLHRGTEGHCSTRHPTFAAKQRATSPLRTFCFCS
jgi:hypothetical protein